MKNNARLPSVILVMILTAVTLAPIATLSSDDSSAADPVDDFSYFDELEHNSMTIYNMIDDATETFTKLIEFDPNDFSENQLPTVEQMELAYYAFTLDNPDCFWLDKKFSYSQEMPSELVKSMTLVFSEDIHSLEELNSIRDAVYSKADEILDRIDGEFRYDKVKQIHDEIVKTVRYDTDATEEDANVPNAHNIYGPLMEGKCVCEGYAKLFKYLCDKLDINTILVIGDGDNGKGVEGHMWNYIVMDDGKWYCMDVTWDDPVGKTDDSIEYDFFLRGSQSKYNDMTFFQSHKPDYRITMEDMSVIDLDFDLPLVSETDYRIHPGNENQAHIIETEEEVMEMNVSDIPGLREMIGTHGTLVIQTKYFQYRFTCEELDAVYAKLTSDSITSLELGGEVSKVKVRSWDYDFLKSIGPLYDMETETDAFIPLISTGDVSSLGLEEITIGLRVGMTDLDVEIFLTVWNYATPDDFEKIHAEKNGEFITFTASSMGTFVAGNNPLSPALNGVPFLLIIIGVVVLIIVIVLLIRGFIRGRRVNKLAKKMSRSRKNMAHYRALYDDRELTSLEKKAFIKAVKLYKKKNKD